MEQTLQLQQPLQQQQQQQPLQQPLQQQQQQQQAAASSERVVQRENARLRAQLADRDEQLRQLRRQLQEAHGSQQ
jgi:hypothetical protein